MRIPRLPLSLLVILGAGLGGCSQTGPLRTAENGDVRTTATIGDRPVSIVGGIADDGAVARADADGGAGARVSSIASAAAEGRISGRVYDEENHPVANARVRLAVGGEPGGKAVFATTDRSGAFTLRGLRPGSNYTLIAEYQGERGMMSGRVDADAPEANARIGLHLRDAGPTGADRIAAARPSKPNLKAVSNADELVEDAADASADPSATTPRGRLNREDLAPTANDEIDDQPADSRRPGGRRDDWDDEVNPLPPARELGGTAGRDGASPTRVARANADEPPPVEEAQPDDGGAAGARTVRPEAFAPIMIDDPEPFSRRIDAAPPVPAEPPGRDSEPTEAKRPTWGEVVSEHRDIPVDEALVKTAAKPEDEAPAAAVAAVAAEAVAQALAPVPAPRVEKADDRAPLLKRKPGPFCEYDANERRVMDLALPDASGRMVSIRDFDADLILLDFWGTWCVPCRKSIPHLKELQASLGGKKLQVIGIACERTPADQRAAKVAEVVKETGINYSILITGMDGSCPVQEALAIQFYPTMILLDREGRILLREEGATDATLARVDRAIAREFDDDGPARP